ncbi:cytochrome c maturation protein CcmE [Rhodobacter sp. KR11]|uniref:cytochrome c maturation protein CcmE n=1 Tax=Rhodobacter sp. KR11 TaxID=2974588 RepID=UPI0022239ACB|nr:cytochrome c maturation protein CcmE [Rhodobacter sp. KR11]MCW1917945.1 cytochrome c maturation protein CcmE [Rhodobacter sp. KR11]
MKGLKKTRRIQIILVTLGALILSTGLIGYAMKDGINLFRSPSQVQSDPPAEGEIFRLGGLVEVGSLVRGQGDKITFTITDSSQTVPVVYQGVLPDLFAEGAGVVALGQMEGNVFVAAPDGILAKHDETYMPKEVVDALKEQGVYVEPTQ